MAVGIWKIRAPLAAFQNKNFPLGVGMEIFEKTIWKTFSRWLTSITAYPFGWTCWMGDLFPMKSECFGFGFLIVWGCQSCRRDVSWWDFVHRETPKIQWDSHENYPFLSSTWKLSCDLELFNGHEQNVFSTTCLGGRTFWMGSSSWRCTSPERFLQCANHSYQTCWYTCQCSLLFFFPALGALVTKQNSPRQWQEKDLPCLPARPCSILLQYSDLHHLDRKLFICVIFLARSGSSK